MARYQVYMFQSATIGEDRTRDGRIFSGGIDSYYSLLRNNDTPNDEGDATDAITDLIAVHGMDIPLNLHGHFSAIEHHLEAAARAVQKTHLVVIANIRTLEDVYDEAWQEIAFGSALAFVAYGLSGRLKEIVIAEVLSIGV